MPVPSVSPLVSVIVPTFNRPDRLLEAVRSIEAQTLRDFEIVVVDDAGADVSALLEPHIQAGRLRYFRHAENRGIAAARNTGLREARGSLVAYLDDDDIFYPQHLEVLAAAFRDPDRFVAYTDAYQAEQAQEDGAWKTVQRTVLFRDAFSADRLLIQNYIPVQSIMHRRECLETCGFFDETFRTHEDLELWLRFSRRYAFLRIEQFTSEFRTRPGSLSGSKERMIDSLRQLYRKHPVDPDASPEIWLHRHRYLDTLQAEELIRNPRFLVSIVVWIEDGWDRLLPCLDAVLKAARDGLYEIVVVGEGAVPPVLPGSLPADFVRTVGGGGDNLAAALNRGAGEARGEYVLFLNAAGRLAAGCLEYLLAAAENGRGIAAVGPKIVRPDGKMEAAGGMVFQDGDRWVVGAGDDPAKPFYALPAQVDYCPVSGLLARKAAFEAVGGFDPGCVPSYAAADLGFSLRGAGHAVAYQPMAMLMQPSDVPPAPDELERSKARFVEKWKDELALCHPSPRLTGKIPLSPSRKRPDPNAPVSPAPVEQAPPSLRLGLPWHLRLYVPLNGPHPLVVSYVKDAPRLETVPIQPLPHIDEGRLRDTMVSVANQVRVLTPDSTLKFMEQVAPFDQMAIEAAGGSYDALLTHTTPLYVGAASWIHHFESPLTIFYPFIRTGKTTGLSLRNTDYFRMVAELFRSPKCRALFTHIQSSYDSVAKLFEGDEAVTRKLRYVRLGVEPKPEALALAKFDRPEKLRILFTNSLHQSPASFYLRGGHNLLKAFQRIRKEIGNIELTILSSPPQDLLSKLAPSDFEGVNWINAAGAHSWPEGHPCANQGLGASAKIDDAALEQLYLSHHFFALPAAGLHSYSFLRALGYGCVPIVSDALGYEEYTGGIESSILEIKGVREQIYTRHEEGWYMDDYTPYYEFSEDYIGQIASSVIASAKPELLKEFAARNLAHCRTHFNVESARNAFSAMAHEACRKELLLRTKRQS